MIYGFFALLSLVLGLLLWRDHGPRHKRPDARKPAPVTPKRHRRKAPARREILVDGSNVMWWDGDTPKLETLVTVVSHLKALGFTPGVIFDASAGHRLFGRYRDDGYMATAIGLPVEQVLVVPKGEVADRFLLMTARTRNLRVVTNDRYRDWLEDFPEAKGRLVQGGFQGGRLWLQLEAREVGTSSPGTRQA